MNEDGTGQASSLRSAPSLPSPESINASVHLHPTRNEDLARVELGVLSVILALTLTGNGFVAVTLYLLRRVKKLTRMNLMIAHLAFADLFVGLFHVLPQLAWKATFLFHGGQYLCKLVTYFQLVAMYGSSYVLLATALDRYMAICYPLKMHVWGSRRMNFVVFVAWTLSGIFSLPQMFIFSYGEHPKFAGVFDCNGSFEPQWTIKFYITWVTSAIYIAPTVALVILYSKICRVVWSSSNWRRSQRKGPSAAAADIASDRDECSETHRHQQQQQQQQHQMAAGRLKGPNVREVSDAKVKTVKLTMAVIASYVVCYGPFFVSQMWAAWDEQAPFEETAMVIIMLLASLNSCTNPWIYLAFNGNFTRYLSCGHRGLPGGRRRLTGGAQRERTSKNSSGVFNSHSRYTSTAATATTATTIDPEYVSFKLMRLFSL